MRAHTCDPAYRLSLLPASAERRACLGGATASERGPRGRPEAELPQVTHSPMNEKHKMFVVTGA